MVLSACGAADSYHSGIVSAGGKFAGIVVADDSHATLVGKEILKAGGNAFDAAAAMALTMSVTLPSRAGLGAGGVCQSFNPSSQKRQVLVFFDENTKEKYAVPALPRAMIALQAEAGRWRWAQTVTPSEYVAKTGFVANRPYTLDNKRIKDEQKVTDLPLAATLASLRANGVQGLYVGKGAKAFMSSAEQSKVTFTTDRLRDFLPKWIDAEKAAYGNDMAYLLPTFIGGADTAADFTSAAKGEKTQNSTLSGSSKAAGLAVVDARGGAVTCVFSMGEPFGTGKEIIGTGVFLSSPTALPFTKGATMMVTNDNVSEFKYVGYMATKKAGEDLVKVADSLMINKQKPDDAFADLVGKSWGGFGAIYCSEGLPNHPETCRFITNKNVGGYGVVVD
jgi:gamma-glutamyltranspeptidase/glutathione hydrolase